MNEDEYIPGSPMFDLGIDAVSIGDAIMNVGNMQNISNDPSWDASRKSQGFYTDEERKAMQYDYGAPSISADDFLDDSGNPKSLKEVVDALMLKFPNSDRTTIANKVKDEMPRFQAVAQKEKEFARQGFKRDMYGLQSDAMKQGAQMRGAYGGMGSSMRGAYAGGQNLQQQYSFAEQDYQKDIYGLEKTAKNQFENEIENFLESGGVGSEDSDAIFKYMHGGKVPNKKEETFLDVLARIPDAKGS